VHPLFLSEAVEFTGSHNALSRSKAPKHGHYRGKSSSIDADRGDDGIWIYELAGSLNFFMNKIGNPSQLGAVNTAARSHLRIHQKNFRCIRVRRAR
jgi:hypothetical protein